MGFLKYNLVLLGVSFFFSSFVLATSATVGKSGYVRFDVTQDDMPLRYFIHDNLFEHSEEIRYGFQQWEDVETAYVSFVQVDSAADAHVTVARNPDLKRSRVTKKRNASRLNEKCDLEVADARLGRDVSSLRRFYTHEFGHCLGLGHSSVKFAMMSYNAQGGETLTDDDALSLTRHYPFNGPDPGRQYPVGCAPGLMKNIGGSDDFGSGGPLVAMSQWFLMIFLGLFFLKRRCA